MRVAVEDEDAGVFAGNGKNGYNALKEFPAQDVGGGGGVLKEFQDQDVGGGGKKFSGIV